MSDLKQFKLPDVGEGLVEAEIVSWKVAVGDVLKVNTVIVEIETAKSLVELPSPFAGVVAELLVTEGSTVDVGSPIITVDVAPGAAAPVGTDHPGDDMVPRLPVDESVVSTPAPDRPVEPGMVGGPVADPAPEERTPTLVGYGPRTGEVKRRARKGRSVPSVPAPELQTAFATDRSVAQPVAPPRLPHAVVPVPSAPEAGAYLPPVGVVEAADIAVPQRVLAKPPVRKLARDLGVDLTTLTPSGPDGVVTREDVQAAADGATSAAPQAVSTAPVPVGTQPREERIPVKGVRKVTAEAMVRSAFTAPHVTEFLTLDVTRTVKLVQKLASDKGFDGVKVSPLLVVAKALLVAVERNPGINAAWDEAAQEIVLKRYVNLGIAAATPRGLVVPNIKEAQAMSLRQLADALAELVATARAGRTQPAEMAHGTISITNVGPFGVDTGTPILPPGETAIVCLGAIAQRPWVHKGKVRPRWVTTLSLSFDHRLVDGELGSRFLADLGAVLHDPRQLVAWG